MSDTATDQPQTPAEQLATQQQQTAAAAGTTNDTVAVLANVKRDLWIGVAIAAVIGYLVLTDKE